MYWRDGSLIVRNYATGAAAAADPLICRILDICGEWTTLTEISAALDLEPHPLLRRIVDFLTARSLLERSDRKTDPRSDAMKALDQWNPEAGFFHTATKDVRYVSAREAATRARAQPRRVPMPPPVKHYVGNPVVPLPKPQSGDEFSRILLARRLGTAAPRHPRGPPQPPDRPLNAPGNGPVRFLAGQRYIRQNGKIGGPMDVAAAVDWTQRTGRAWGMPSIDDQVRAIQLTRENRRLAEENDRLRTMNADLAASAEIWIRLYEAALARTARPAPVHAASDRFAPWKDEGPGSDELSER